MTKSHPFYLTFFLLLISILSVNSGQAKALSIVLESETPDVSTWPSGSGPGDDSPRIEEKVPVGAIPDKSQNTRRLDSSLSILQKSYDTQGWFAVTQAASTSNVEIIDGTVRVILSAESGRAAEVIAELPDINIYVEGSYGDLIQALVPIDRLSDVSGLPGLLYVKTPDTPVAMAVSNEGMGVTAISSWHDMGFRGRGVKIGVLDVGFEGYPALLARELPPSVTVRSLRSDGDITGEGSNHGTAVAELVYDVAPESAYYFANFQTEVEFAKAADWLAEQGVTVIVTAVGWPGAGPGDGSGHIVEVVKTAKARGILWTQAAGNFAQTHWTGQYQDPEGNGFHNFTLGDEGNTITLIPSGKGETVFVVEVILTWDDWQTYFDDYDLFLFKGDQVVAQSVSFQGGSFPPVERFRYVTPTPGTYWIGIQRFRARKSGRLDLLITVDHKLEHKIPGESLIIPADAADAVAVGAVSPNGLELQPFSSQGPTKDGRIKPDLVAPDGLSTATYGPGAFPGTSATVALVGGAAALVKQAAPRYSPDQIRAYLESNAVRLGSQEKNNQYGFGLLRLAQAPPRLVFPIMFNEARLR